MVTEAGSNRVRWQRVRRILRRGARWLLGTAGVVLVLLLALLLTLLLPAVRGSLLAWGLSAADRALPGTLTVARATWPGPGRLVLEDLVWTEAPGDTLAVARRLELAFSWRSLVGRDLEVEALAIHIAQADVPRIQGLFPAGTDSAVSPSDTTGAPVGIPWLRSGAADGMPSLALRRLAVDADRLVPMPDVVVRGLHLEGSVDGIHGGAGLGTRLALELSGERGGDAPLFLDLDSLDLAAVYGPEAGRVRLDTLTITGRGGPADRRQEFRNAGAVRLALGGEAQADVDAPAQTPFSLALEGRVDCPFAPLLGAAWPDSLPVAEYQRAALAFDLQAERREAGPVVANVVLDLEGTDGLHRGLIGLSARGDPAAPATIVARLDTLDLAATGCTVRGSGSLDADTVALALVADVATPMPLLALAGPVFTGADLTLGLDLAVAGPRDAPTARFALATRFRDEAMTAVGDSASALDLDVAGTVALAALGADLPFRADLEGHASGPWSALPDSAWSARLGAAGLKRGAVAFAVVAEGSVAGPVAGDLDLDLAGTDGLNRGLMRLSGSFDPRHPQGVRAHLDTIDLDVEGGALRGRGALTDSTVSLDLQAHAASPIPLLALAGLGPEAVDLTLDLDLSVHGPRNAPAGHVDLAGSYADAHHKIAGARLTADGGREGLAAHGAVGQVVWAGATVVDSLVCGLDYAPSRTLPLELGVSVNRDANRLAAMLAAGYDSLATVRLDTLQLVVADRTLRLEAPTVLRADTTNAVYAMDPLVLSGDPGRLALAGSSRQGDLDLKADLDLLLTESMLAEIVPSEIWSRDGGVDLALQGDVTLGVEDKAPRFQGAVLVEMRPHRNRPRVGARLTLGLAEGEDSGLVAELSLTADDTVLVRGTAFAPGSVDTAGRGWRPDIGRDLEILVPEQRLSLAHFASFLPPETSATGTVRLAADVRWPLGLRTSGEDLVGTGSLAASVAGRGLTLTLPNRSRLELEVDYQLSGTPLAPHLGGDLTVVSGFIRIPELPPSLLPTEGTSQLWQTAHRDTAGLIRALGPLAVREWSPDQDVLPPAAPLPDMNLRVHLPGNLRINGYGLDAILAGDIVVTRGEDDKGRPGPSLQGSVGTVRGTLRFMNRQFEIDRGNVRFTGDVPANPELDLHMWTRTGGYRVMIGVSGRAAAPVVELTSEPDLQQADVAAVLLFGRPLNDLDSDQRGRASEEGDASQQLQENLAGLALVFGTKGMQDSMTSTLGVDMVEIGSDSSGGTTVAAGKYINANMLLKYHQSLEKSGTYFMTLEYILSQVFRIVTTYGQGEEASGVELKWERRY